MGKCVKLKFQTFRLLQQLFKATIYDTCKNPSLGISAVNYWSDQKQCNLGKCEALLRDKISRASQARLAVELA